MCENVHEWCADWYAADFYAQSPVRNPRGPDAGTRRVSRGGSWRHRVTVTRCAARSSLPPDLRYTDYGFRIVETRGGAVVATHQANKPLPPAALNGLGELPLRESWKPDLQPLAVAPDGGRGGAGICLDPTGAGNLTKSNIKWKAPAMDGLGSPIIVDGLLYRLLNPDVLRVYKLATGEKVYSHRLEGATSWPSPVATADGVVYFASAGKSYVLKAGPKFDLLATNDLGDPNNASPAVAGAYLILKGQKFLWCIGNK